MGLGGIGDVVTMKNNKALNDGSNSYQIDVQRSIDSILQNSMVGPYTWDELNYDYYYHRINDACADDTKAETFANVNR